jgi:DNA-binding transcriptional regulator GbsR (MarR family)
MACKELREWGLILSEPVAGARRTRHRVDADLERVMRNIIEHRKRREWDPILEQLRAWLPRLQADRSPDSAIFRARLLAIESCLAAADAMAQSFLQGGTLERLDLDILVQKSTPRRRAES